MIQSWSPHTRTSLSSRKQAVWGDGKEWEERGRERRMEGREGEGKSEGGKRREEERESGK